MPTTAIKERPILFSGEMVRAILDGRKTQTRRIVKCKDLDFQGGGEEWNDPRFWGFETENGYWFMLKADPKAPDEFQIPCPYGNPGERLWVRETFAYTDQSLNVEPGYVYRATDPDWSTLDGFKWKPSIFMPREASRITLEITDVRVERLQEISREDAIAEGAFLNERDWWELGNGLRGMSSPQAAFLSLWELINGPESWDANPFVWKISFRRIN